MTSKTSQAYLALKFDLIQQVRQPRQAGQKSKTSQAYLALKFDVIQHVRQPRQERIDKSSKTSQTGRTSKTSQAYLALKFDVIPDSELPKDPDWSNSYDPFHLLHLKIIKPRKNKFKLGQVKSGKVRLAQVKGLPFIFYGQKSS